MADFEIEVLLQKAVGLKVTSIGKAHLERAVRRRMKALAIADKTIYVANLKSSALELKELIEEVVIPETWFFRDGEPFRVMVKYLITRWAPKHRDTLCKVLSVPCATGEEPYSLAMSLLGAGWPAEKFTIHAVDISHRSIARAKEGIYSEHSFRGSDPAYKGRYFEQVHKFYLLNKHVRQKVHFHTGNILNLPFMESLGSFDVIFFRNVLIYFDAPARHQAIATLYKILRDDGILFVGHAEANLFSSSPFTAAPYPQAFAFHKKPRQRLAAAQTAESVVPESVAVAAGGTAVTPDKSDGDRYDLGWARTLADRGELVQATAICKEFLARQGPSAQAFCLLGIIHDVAGDVGQAEKLFRQALYLDPHHEETLVFLSLLTEKTGDAAGTRALKQRLARLQEKRTVHRQNR